MPPPNEPLPPAAVAHPADPAHPAHPAHPPNPGPSATEADSGTGADGIQRQVVRTLVTSQILGGIGLSAGAAVGSLLAEQVSGSATWAGLGGTFQVLGAALLAVPIAAITARSGRRPALALGYAVAAVGAAAMVVSGVLGSFALLLAASVLVGGATAANSQSRYAAADLSAPDRRGRDLSLVVWATTVGSVLGPNLVTPATPLAQRLGLPVLTGPFLVSAVVLVAAAGNLAHRLRPDPLVLARQREVERGGIPTAPPHGKVSRGLAVTLALPAARLGLLAIAVGHAVMVAVMVMTPLHMRHGHAELSVIGFVLSVHIVGMYALSPLMGWAADRFGGRALALVGSMVLTVATLLSSRAPSGSSTTLLLALFLLGVGWSATMVGGSTLLVVAVPLTDRPAAQGAADLVMGLTAAAAGAVAGVVVERADYHVLSLVALGFALVIGIGAALTPGPGSPTPAPGEPC